MSWPRGRGKAPRRRRRGMGARALRHIQRRSWKASCRRREIDGSSKTGCRSSCCTRASASQHDKAHWEQLRVVAIIQPWSFKLADISIQYICGTAPRTPSCGSSPRSSPPRRSPTRTSPSGKTQATSARRSTGARYSKQSQPSDSQPGFSSATSPATSTASWRTQRRSRLDGQRRFCQRWPTLRPLRPAGPSETTSRVTRLSLAEPALLENAFPAGRRSRCSKTRGRRDRIAVRYCRCPWGERGSQGLLGWRWFLPASCARPHSEGLRGSRTRTTGCLLKGSRSAFLELAWRVRRCIGAGASVQGPRPGLGRDPGDPVVQEELLTFDDGACSQESASRAVRQGRSPCHGHAAKRRRRRNARGSVPGSLPRNRQSGYGQMTDVIDFFLPSRDALRLRLAERCSVDAEVPSRLHWLGEVDQTDLITAPRGRRPGEGHPPSGR